MTAHGLTTERTPTSPPRRPIKNGLLQLGWAHYWLLSGILAGMLGLVVLIFFAQLVSR